MYPQPVPVIATDPNLTGMPMAPMGPVMVPPYAGPMINSPQNFVYIQDPFTEIAQSRTAIVRQEPALLERLTGCVTRNHYHVFLSTPYGLKYAFKCNEQSGGCARCCLSANSRPVKIIMRHVISFQQYDGDMAKVFINVDKPCKCA